MKSRLLGKSSGSVLQSALRAAVEPLERRVLCTSEQHTIDLVLGAFGGTPAPTGPGTPTLHQIIIPNTVPKAEQPILGVFGAVNGKNQKFTMTASDGTQSTFSLSGGSATAFQDGIAVRLAITGSGGALNIVTKGGSGILNLTTVNVDGSLKSFTAKTADLAGTMSATGTLGKIMLRNVNGIIASAGGSIGSIVAASLSGAGILSGANLGTDDMVGGTGTNADTYAAGLIGTIQITGQVTSSVVGAGIDITNGVNTVVGGKASSIRSIVVRGGTDSSSRFVAGAFGAAKLPKKVITTTDARFVMI